MSATQVVGRSIAYTHRWIENYRAFSRRAGGHIGRADTQVRPNVVTLFLPRGAMALGQSGVNAEHNVRVIYFRP